MFSRKQIGQDFFFLGVGCAEGLMIIEVNLYNFLCLVNVSISSFGSNQPEAEDWIVFFLLILLLSACVERPTSFVFNLKIFT